MIVHPIPPVVPEGAKILILGSFPSVKSRETAFFYGHPQNRFWRVLAALLEEDVPATVEDKRALLLRHKIAVWDVIGSCEIVGSADSTIKNAAPNDLRPLLAGGTIRRIYTNGKTAGAAFARYQTPLLGLSSVTLPSTSPANAAWSLEKLIDAWSVILEDL